MKRGFTLVELLVAIALVLILMVGVNQVFKTTAATVGATNAISDNVRDARAAQTTFTNDLSSIAPDGPCLLLLSCTQAAFRNHSDELSKIGTGSFLNSPALAIDLDGNNSEGDANVPGERISAATYNYRNHRTDIFSFFGRGLFARQTGGTVASSGLTPFIADMTSPESWIWFGHLRLPDNVGNFGTLTDPGAGTFGANQNNYYATQWILGREQFLLADKSTDDNAGTISDRAGASQIFVDRSWTYTDATSPRVSLTPLSYQSGANVSGYSNESSRLDLAATTISTFNMRLAEVISDHSGIANYDWYSRLFLSTGRRFQANPFLIRPMTPATFSQQSPMFMRGCTQFIVEYAGDFLKQDNDPTSATYGDVTDTCYDSTTNTPLATDGVIDYVLVNGRREIRWYGMPRDVDGGGINSANTQTAMRGVRDVLPLRDYWQLVARESVFNAPWEKNVAAKLPRRLDYSDVSGAGALGMQANDQYICAWGPNDRNRPKMIRIIITLDDPGGRLPGTDGQTFEYVYQVP